MSRRKILAIVLAGGAGGRMDVLTRERAKPSLPFGGVFQLIDFPLSNLLHSGVDHVWVSVQYQASSLDYEIANGRPWDLDRTHGGFRLLPPQEGAGSAEDGLARGNADVLFRVRDLVRAAEPELVLVMSSDHVYRMDYTDAINRHDERGAECTIVTTEVPEAEAPHHATVMADRAGWVTDFAYKSASPTTCVVATEIFVYDPTVLVQTLEELQTALTEASPEGDTGLGDFGEHLLPRLVERGKACEYRMDGYWRDVGRPDAYFAAQRDLLDNDLGVFGVPEWPILSRTQQGRPARMADGAEVSDSLVSPGCEVYGVVRRSVLGPDVYVAEGATVTDSILFAGARVEGGTVSWSILDTEVVVEADAVVGGAPVGDLPTSDELVLVGRDSKISSGASVAAGARLEPGTTV
ncbi:MAG: Glucose-1-phosphate adenylyltransferase [uncultured Nocardioidaceae bacterium]|uniref:Glucose-1-phosphate adenylyltransferase n=1 Tax=uncultured Nocardioidaceae bacterium TaxID=253824 RepID=A0A6J4MTR3_9ACTN|nr:MAG: Glucose-1-phosphate adenylyltransferase [uncultured Nocardioidaceae bacterium]